MLRPFAISIASLFAVMWSAAVRADDTGCGGLSATDEVMWACNITKSATFESRLSDAAMTCCGLTPGYFAACTSVPCKAGDTIPDNGYAAKCYSDPKVQAQEACPPEQRDPFDMLTQPHQQCASCCATTFWANFQVNTQVAGGAFKVTGGGMVSFVCQGQMRALSTCNVNGNTIVPAGQDGCYVTKQAEARMDIVTAACAGISLEAVIGDAQATIKASCLRQSKPKDGYKPTAMNCSES